MEKKRKGSQRNSIIISPLLLRAALLCLTQEGGWKEAPWTRNDTSTGKAKMAAFLIHHPVFIIQGQRVFLK
jgi:hypothetical protein